MARHADPRSSETASGNGRPSRGTIVRDTIIFQIKLTLDGFKDIVLAPLSIAAAALDLFRGDESEGHLYQVLRLGHRFDHWLDLYGEARGKTIPQIDGVEDQGHTPFRPPDPHSSSESDEEP